MVIIGLAATLSPVSRRLVFIESLLYGIKGSDAGMFALPSLIIAAGSSLAALPAVVRAVRVDAATTLRAE